MTIEEILKQVDELHGNASPGQWVIKKDDLAFLQALQNHWPEIKQEIKRLQVIEQMFTKIMRG